MVTIVKWVPSLALPLSVWDPPGDGVTTFTYVPAEHASILYDESDVSYLDTGVPVDDGQWTDRWHATLTPTSPVPAGSPLWARFHVRWSGATDWIALLGAWVDNDGYGKQADAAVWMNGGLWVNGDPEGGIVTNDRTVYPEPGHEQWFDPDQFAMFERGYPWTVFVDQAYFQGSNFYERTYPGRWHEFWVEVAYEGGTPLPLRQVPRDDALAFGGVIRAPAGTSVQSSIRQAGGSYW